MIKGRNLAPLFYYRGKNKMSLFAQFETNAELENVGISVTYGPNKNGSIPTFIISRTGKSNKAYMKALNKAQRPVQKQIQLGTLPDEQSEQIYLDVFVSTVLKGWSNVYDKEGKELAFNKQNAIKLLKQLPELYDDLFAKANNAALFREEELEEEAKN